MLFYEPVEENSLSSDPRQSALVETKTDTNQAGEQESEENEAEEEDEQIPESVSNIEKVVSPARRIRALMLLASGANELA